MRLAIGLLLVFGGAVMGYLVLTGRFPDALNNVFSSDNGSSGETKPSNGANGSSGEKPASNTTDNSALHRGKGGTMIGSGGQSWQSKLSSLGHLTPSVHSGDRRAPKGGF